MLQLFKPRSHLYDEGSQCAPIGKEKKDFSPT